MCVKSLCVKSLCVKSLWVGHTDQQLIINADSSFLCGRPMAWLHTFLIPHSSFLIHTQLPVGLVWPMACLHLVASIKLYVSFAKEPYKRDDILQKRPIILSILLTVGTPYFQIEILRMPLDAHRIVCVYSYVHVTSVCHKCILMF